MMKLLHKNNLLRQGFTLVEVLTSALIVALLATVLFVVLRSNLSTMAWGQKHMDFNYKIQYFMKQFYTDIKKINPHVYVHKYGHLYVKGEASGEYFPNVVRIEKDIVNNSGSELSFVLSSLKSDSEAMAIKYYYDKKTKTVMRHVKPANGSERFIPVARNSQDLRFHVADNDPKSVRITCKIFDDKRSEVFEDVDFTVRLEGDLMTVKVFE
ncbi:MAG: prepilin-type N-terminal cleavage/methylation domain-containing protein [Candidatus Riflebacteria bacterium]|nr:prepilin-type N-terminal cleavage/methylation domain-containing protein [Candidatus Riflebacteria bacterium]